MDKMNKKGDYKWAILINLILGLIILGISLYFIFAEFIIEEDINYELCRQSVVLRQQAINKGGTVFGSEVGFEVAENFPFKCQASHKVIDYKDYDKAGIEIMDTMASCHALYGNGDSRLYAQNWLSSENMCFQCYRISFTPEVQEFYSPLSYNPSKKIIEIEDQINLHLGEIETMYPGGSGKLDIDILLLYISLNASNPGQDAILEEISSKKQLLEEIKSIELKIISLESEIGKLQLLATDTSNNVFHWKNYLFNKMKGTNMTYAQFIYGFDEEQKARLSKSEFELLTSIEYSSEFNSRLGDIIITYVYQKDSTVGVLTNEKWWDATVLAYQTNQNPSCDIYETIPA